MSVVLEDLQEKINTLQNLVQEYQRDGHTSLRPEQCAPIAQVVDELSLLTTPPGSAAWEFCFMPYTVATARLALDLNIFRSLASKSPQTAEELAQQAHAHTKSPNVEVSFIIRIMRIITYYGCVTETAPATYAANPRTFVMADSGFASALVHNFDQHMTVMHHSVPYFAAHGYVMPTDDRVGPVQDYYKTEMTSYELWRADPAVMANFNNFMRATAGASIPWFEWFKAADRIKQHHPAKAARHTSDLLLVDIGGGKGLMIHALRAYLQNAGVKGRLILEDMKMVAEEAREAGAAEESASPHPDIQIDYLAHDFFTPQPAEAQHALFYYVHFIMHNWSDEHCVEILKGAAAAMKPGYSRLLINERVLQPMGNSFKSAALDIVMAIAHAARERTVKEFEEIINKAGMQMVGWHRSPDGGEDVVECMLA